MTRKIQAFQENYIFIAIVYLIIIFLETLGHMEGGFTHFTFPSASAPDFLACTHPTLLSWVCLHRIWGYVVWKGGLLSCLKL